MISKELLLAVMPDIEKHDKVEIKIIEDELWFRFVRQKYKHKPNIYELAHKCKEWAADEGYTIQSWIFGKHDSGKAKIIGLISDFHGDDLPLISANTELEAIFQACEWILEQKEVEDEK